MIVFSYSDETKMRFAYDLVRKNYIKAFTIAQTAKLLGRPAKEVHNLIHRNLVPKPTGRSYHIESKRPDQYFWAEADVLVLRDAIYDNAIKDKYGKARIKIKSKSEILAEMHGDSSYYVKAEDGSFVKVWKAI